MGQQQGAERRRVGVWLPAAILLLTTAQLAVAQWVPGIERFEGKAFGARLLAYPVLMLLVPAIWWLVVGRRRRGAEPPHGAFALVMLGFLVDVTGNSLDLYDAVVWWDDLNHLVNWALLLLGIGLLVGGRVEPTWALVLVVAGSGALLAVAWELGEWWTFIRHGTEIDTAYEDTLGDQALGSLGALVAGLVLAGRRRRSRTGRVSAPPAEAAPGRPRAALLVPATVWLALVGLLVVAAATPGHFGDPAAPYRLVAYPLLALVLPATWLLSRTPRPLPAVATTLVTAPFLIDTIGNVGDLYARISWWDDVNHLTNWLLLSGGIGLAVAHRVRPRWALALLVTGLGALLAVVWELGERAFFYDPPYSARLYEDTLADQSLGTAGALLAGLLVAGLSRRATPRPAPADPTGETAPPAGSRRG